MKRIFLGTVIFVLGLASLAFAHCQVPCGIYDDHLRIHQMEEDIQTIEKSMTMILELSKAEEANYNQIVRWVNNKEDYAKSISDTVVEYYMAQRLKPIAVGEAGYERYIRELKLLHEILVLAMKAKQTTDLGTVSALKSTLADFERSYFEGEAQVPVAP
jgi:nickel superoxide dismutase